MPTAQTHTLRQCRQLLSPFMTTAASLALAASNFTRGIVPSLIVVRDGVAARSAVFLLGGTTDGSRLRANDSSLLPPQLESCLPCAYAAVRSGKVLARGALCAA